MNRVWLRFLPIIGILLVNLAFWQDWITKSTWLVLLLVFVAVYTLLSIVFFPIRREIFTSTRKPAPEPRDE